MFSNIDNVNILTAVLASHGVRRVVVCPGSRNAPIVHNLNEMDGITCYPVTDERSAGFVAMGIALGNPSPCPDPVAVCVTSGSALLNLYPAVCEAYYQKLPIIIISADRPEAWIASRMDRPCRRLMYSVHGEQKCESSNRIQRGAGLVL